MLAQTPVAVASPADAVVHYGFAGASLGLDLQAWRMKRPDAMCAPSGGKSEAIVCSVADQAIGGGYRARRLAFVFLDGRLAQIRFRSSIDGFSNVVATLKQDFGAPTVIRRDSVSLDGTNWPHVAFSWKNGRSTIQLTDPVAPGNRLSVTMTLDAAAARLSDPQAPGGLGATTAN